MDLKVYRAFRHPEWAEAFATGHIWLSTLEACRRTEDDIRADPEEAKEIYRTGRVESATHSPEQVRLIALRAGIHLSESVGNVVLADNTSERKLKDAWVVCASHSSARQLLDKFGPHVVAIRDYRSFLLHIHHALSHDFSQLTSVARPVIYRDNAYHGLDSRPGPIGFVKRPGYSDEAEFRFLWHSPRAERISTGFLRQRLPRSLFARIR